MVASLLFALMGHELVAKHTFSYDAIFLEGCSCKEICFTEITGTDAACHGLAAMEFRKATYNGKDFSHTKAAWAWGPGWVQLYVDADESKRTPLTDFLKAALADWGAMEKVQSATVRFQTPSGQYSATIGGGTIGSLSVKPVFGRDGKTAVVHRNLTSIFHDELSQGKISDAWYHDKAHESTWKDTNAFFNTRCRMSGKI